MTTKYEREAHLVDCSPERSILQHNERLVDCSPERAILPELEKQNFL